MLNRFDITLRTIILAILFIGGIWLLIQVRDILALLFISFILMAALRPGVDQLEKLKLPRLLATFIIYIVVFGILISFGTVVFPPLISESVRLAVNLPKYIPEIAPYIDKNLDMLVSQIAPLSQNVARLTVGIFSNLVSTLTVAVFTFYFLLEHDHLADLLSMFVGKNLGERITSLVHKTENRLGAWVRGQAALALIIGFASYLGLVLLGINFALPLALIAGLLEIVPIIGPIVSAIPAILVALTVSPGLAMAVVALYFIIQQLENNLIVPQVMQKTVGLPPVATLIALMIGGRLGGVIGIILSIPTLLVIQTLVKELLTSSKK